MDAQRAYMEAKMKHQDYIYLKEDYYNNPKETFRFILNLIKTFYKKKLIQFQIWVAQEESGFIL